MLQGRTKPLQQLPSLLHHGQYLSMGKANISNFIGSVDSNTIMWSLSFPAPESKAAELNFLFKDPAAAQVTLRRLAAAKISLHEQKRHIQTVHNSSISHNGSKRPHNQSDSSKQPSDPGPLESPDEVLRAYPSGIAIHATGHIPE